MHSNKVGITKKHLVILSYFDFIDIENTQPASVSYFHQKQLL